jgi:hypothetical protein
MERITMPDIIIAQLKAALGPIEIVDEQGVSIGKFVPPKVSDCPHSPEDLDRIRRQSGRPLADIWKSLGAK